MLVMETTVLAVLAGVTVLAVILIGFAKKSAGGVEEE